MYLYVEMWNAKHEWLMLDAASRQAFMDKVNNLLGSLMGPDIKLAACALNDGDTTPRADFRYVAVWNLKDKAQVARIADGTARIGWYKYFSQVNMGGDAVGPEVLTAEMMGL
jgi:hypothetical protein